MDESNPHRWDEFELSVAADAYHNAETPEEAFDIVTFMSGAGTRDQAVLNLCSNATSHSIRSALASILLGWLDEGHTEAVLATLASIAKHDYRHMMGDSPEEDKL